MAINTYATLITAVTEWLARDQDATLIARIPDFIVLTEAKLNRLLFVRQMEQRAITVIDTTVSEPDYIALPTDFQSMRRMRLSSVSGKPLIAFMSGTQMDDFRNNRGNATGQPQYFTIYGTEIELAPTPDKNYTVEMIYRKLIPALTASNTTNWLLTLAPDLYLYGVLLESSPYIQADERIATWGAGFSSALDGLNNLGMSSTFNAGPIQVRILGATP